MAFVGVKTLISAFKIHRSKNNARNNCEYVLQNIKAELSGPGDDAALARLVSSQDEVGRSQHLSLSQPAFGFCVAGEDGDNRARQAAFGRDSLWLDGTTSCTFELKC